MKTTKTNDSYLYLIKCNRNLFKYGQTRDISKRVSGLKGMGQGYHIKLIATSKNATTEERAREIEKMIHYDIVRDTMQGETCNYVQAKQVLSLIQRELGIEYNNRLSVTVEETPTLRIGQKINIKVTEAILESAKCETFGKCMYAQGFRCKGFAVPRVAVNETAASFGGKRYFFKTPTVACHALTAFDNDKSSVKPHNIDFEVVKIEDIKTKTSWTKTKEKIVTKPVTKPRLKSSVKKPKGNDGGRRHHGTVQCRVRQQEKLDQIMGKKSA